MTTDEMYMSRAIRLAMSGAGHASPNPMVGALIVAPDGRVIGVFYYTQGADAEPNYREILNGAWTDNSPYGVVHRIAGDGSEKGIGTFCLNWAYSKCGHLRIDTHGDNFVMQNLLKKLGFVHCGTVYVEEDDYPRLGYEKTGNTGAGSESC